MSIIHVAIDVNAPAAVCFDMARSVDAHIESARVTGERAVAGAFRRLVHDHYFEPVAGGTRMRDVFDFTAPFGPLGTLADRLMLHAYLKRFLENRAQALKRLAESGAGNRFIVK